MTELPKCGRVQIDSHMKCQKCCGLSQKIKFDKIWTKIDRTVEIFIINHMHLIMGNYLVKLFFII